MASAWLATYIIIGLYSLTLDRRTLTETASPQSPLLATTHEVIE